MVTELFPVSSIATTLGGFRVKVRPLESYHQSPEAAAERCAAFVWATHLDTLLMSTNILLRVVLKQNFLCGAV